VEISWQGHKLQARQSLIK